MTRGSDIRGYIFIRVGAVVLGVLSQSTWADTVDVRMIDIFTTTERPVAGMENSVLGDTTITLYEVDGIERFEASLSRGLPLDRSAAEPEALRRIQQLDASAMAHARHAAVGLSEAMQYGVDRYPAIVFDERAVVYGVANVVEALDRYTAWRRNVNQ